MMGYLGALCKAGCSFVADSCSKDAKGELGGGGSTFWAIASLRRGGGRGVELDA